MEYRCEVELQNQYLNSLKKRNVMLFFLGGGKVDFQVFCGGGGDAAPPGPTSFSVLPSMFITQGNKIVTFGFLPYRKPNKVSGDCSEG